MENNKQAIDEGKNVGLILDLSQAFDCLPHRLLSGKLNAYGISYEACSLIKSYICQRFQRVKSSRQGANGKSCRKEYEKDRYLVLLYLQFFYKW